VFYGVYEQGVDSLADTVPNVRVTTLQGIEIVPPCFDQDSEYLYGYRKSTQKSGDVATMLQNLEDSMAAQQEQIDKLRAAQNMIAIHGDNDGHIPEDNPQL
jgi:hypothetical protein